MANNTLKQMGIPPNEPDLLEMIDSALPSRYQSPEPHTRHNIPGQDPLLTIDKQEIYHAIEVYKEDLHPIYPFLPVDDTRKILPAILNYLDSGTNLDSSDRGNNYNSVSQKDVKILKMIVATVLVLKGGGNSMLAQRLVDNVERASSTSPRLVEIDIQELQVLTMTVSFSIFYFLALPVIQVLKTARAFIIFIVMSLFWRGGRLVLQLEWLLKWVSIVEKA